MKKKLVVLVILAMAVFSGGCQLKELVICEYEAKGIVEVPQPKTGTMTAKAVPAAVLDFLAAVFPTIGQSRRKAMQEKVNYEEWRVFRPLRLQFKSEKEEKP